MRKWKKGRILKECGQHSERLRGEVSAYRELCQQTSLLPRLWRLSALQTTTVEHQSDMWGLNLAGWVFFLSNLLFCDFGWTENAFFAHIRGNFLTLTSQIGNKYIKFSHTKSCCCNQHQPQLTFFHTWTRREWKVVINTQEDQYVIQKNSMQQNIHWRSSLYAMHCVNLNALLYTSFIFTISVLPADEVLIVLQDSPQLRVIVDHPLHGLCTHRDAPWPQIRPWMTPLGHQHPGTYLLHQSFHACS